MTLHEIYYFAISYLFRTKSAPFEDLFEVHLGLILKLIVKMASASRVRK